MKKTLLFLALFFIGKHCFSQDNSWLLGCTTNNPDSSTMALIDFKKNNFIYPPVVKKMIPSISFSFSHEIITTGVADEEGHFKLNFDGGALNKVPYPNSLSFKQYLPPSVAKAFALDYNNTDEQRALLLPHLSLKENYMLFATDDVNGTKSLYYSLINLDSTTNNGNPIAIKKAVIATEKFEGGGVTVCRHINGVDWWMLLREKKADMSVVFHSFLIDKQGIKPIDKQPTAYQSLINAKNIHAAFSPDGNYYVAMQTLNNKEAIVELFPFDRCKGKVDVSKVKTISFPNGLENSWGGIAFSENSRFLYITTGSALYQYDVQTEENIQLYKLNLTFPYCTTLECFLNDLRLAPDGRIYIVSVDKQTMSVIKKPNEKGLSCDFKLNDLNLPTINCSLFLPNHAYYKLGKGECPTATNDIPHQDQFMIFPNPGNEELNISALNEAVTESAKIQFYDAVGRLVLSQSLDNVSTVNCNSWAKGLYTYQILDNGKLLQVGKWVKM